MISSLQIQISRTDVLLIRVAIYHCLGDLRPMLSWRSPYHGLGSFLLKKETPTRAPSLIAQGRGKPETRKGFFRAERGNSLVPAAGAQIFKIGRCTTKIVRAPALAVPTLKKKRLSSSSFFSFFSFLLFFFFFFFFFPSPFLALGCILRACATCV